MKKLDIKNLILKHKKTVIIGVISAFALGGGIIYVKGKIKSNKKETPY